MLVVKIIFFSVIAVRTCATRSPLPRHALSAPNTIAPIVCCIFISAIAIVSLKSAVCAVRELVIFTVICDITLFIVQTRHGQHGRMHCALRRLPHELEWHFVVPAALSHFQRCCSCVCNCTSSSSCVLVASTFSCIQSRPMWKCYFYRHTNSIFKTFFMGSECRFECTRTHSRNASRTCVPAAQWMENRKSDASWLHLCIRPSSRCEYL